MDEERRIDEMFQSMVRFAVHDDQGVSAFDWRDVASALGLAEGC